MLVRGAQRVVQSLSLVLTPFEWRCGWLGPPSALPLLQHATSDLTPHLPLLLQASLLSGVVLAHGDDAGVRLPPSLAPVQVRRGEEFRSPAASGLPGACTPTNWPGVCF